jgi:two-component system OmpR family sensor kinase
VPIRLRLAILFAVFAALLCALGGFVFVKQLEANLRESLDAGLRPRAEAIASSLRTRPSDGARAAIPGDEPLAQVIRADGTLLASTPAMGDGPTLSGQQLRSALGGQIAVERPLPSGDRDGLRLPARPAALSEGMAVVVVGSSLGPVDDAVRDVAGELAVGGGTIVLAAGLGAWILAGAALRPVERMGRQAAAISERADARLGCRRHGTRLRRWHAR